MKKKITVLAAGVALCALLCACAPKETEAAQTPAHTQSDSEADFDVIFDGLEPREEDETPIEQELFLESLTADGSYDEIVSYQLAYPYVEDPAYAALNPLFEEDLAYLKGECAGAVLEKVSARSAVANVTGTFTDYYDGNLLWIDYDLTVQASDSETRSYLSHTACYDLQTCTRVED